MYLFSVAGEKLTMRIRSRVFMTMLKQEMAWYDQKEHGVGALCAKLSAEAAQVQGVRYLQYSHHLHKIIDCMV